MGLLPIAEAPLRRASGPVLLVEHYLPLVKPLMRSLEEEGIVAHLARSDTEADALAHSTAYAAVVVAWNVPRRGGAALVRGWRRDGLTVPVLMIAASASEADLLEGAHAGANDALPFPFSLEELLARLWPWVVRARET